LFRIEAEYTYCVDDMCRLAPKMSLSVLWCTVRNYYRASSKKSDDTSRSSRVIVICNMNPQLTIFGVVLIVGEKTENIHNQNANGDATSTWSHELSYGALETSHSVVSNAP